MQDEQHEADEAQLVREVLQGQRECYALLVQRYMPRVHALLLRLSGSQDCAEELSQETFIKAYRNLASFRGEARFSTWLTRIALNQASSYFSSRRYKDFMRAEPLDVERHDMSSEQAGESQEKELRLRRTREAILELDAKHREVLLLCALQGKSYQEAAQILEIPIGTVRSRLNKARLLLKDAILHSENVR